MCSIGHCFECPGIVHLIGILRERRTAKMLFYIMKGGNNKQEISARVGCERDISKREMNFGCSSPRSSSSGCLAECYARLRGEIFD